MVAKIARFLAPIALAAVGVGVYLIVHSTVVHHDHDRDAVDSPTVANGPRHKARKHRRLPKFYIVKSGDTLAQDLVAHATSRSCASDDLNSSLAQTPTACRRGSG